MPDKFQTMNLPPLAAGMATTVNSPALDDRYGRDLLNMEYVLDDMPQTRKGMTCWSEESIANHKFDKRVTGMHYFKNENVPEGCLLIGSGNDIYRSSLTIDDRAYQSIKGSKVFDDDADIHFIEWNERLGSVYDGGTAYTGLELLGWIDQNTSIVPDRYTNIFYWYAGGSIRAANNNFFVGSMLEMNRRVFYIPRGQGDITGLSATSFCWSALGHHMEIDPNGTGSPTAAGFGNVQLPKTPIGLGKTRDRLFIFCRDAIYQLMFGEPPTDQNLFALRLLTDDGGCISKSCIVPVLDDLWFLSDTGWVSINAVQKFGDFDQALVGDKILDLKNIPRVGADGELHTARAINYTEKNQVWLSIPSSSTAEAHRRYNEKCYIMGYKSDIMGIAETDKKFSRFSGRAPFTAACLGTLENRRRLFVAAPVPMDEAVGLAASLTTGGTNPIGDYYFKLVAVDQYGEETTVSDEVHIAVADATNDRIHLTWTAHPNATNIRIYKGSTSNGQTLYKQRPGNATSYDWNDDTSDSPVTQAPPTINLAKIHNIFLTDDKDTLADDVTKFGGTAVEQILESHVETKDYVFGNEGIKKIGDYWEALVRLLDIQLSLVVTWIFDFNPNKSKTVSFSLDNPVEAKWDEAIWDSSVWATGSTEFQKLQHRFFSQVTGRIFNAVRFRFKCTTGKRWGFRGLSMDIAGLDEKESSDAA